MNNFNRIARSVFLSMKGRVAAEDKNEEWQQVNANLADALRDAHVLYAKLARLQGDFSGDELRGLQTISENILTIGGKLSEFSKAFYEGHLNMSSGGDEMGGSVAPPPGGAGAPFESMPEVPEGLDESPEDAPEEGMETEVEFDYESPSQDSESGEESSDESDEGESEQSEESEEPEED